MNDKRSIFLWIGLGAAILLGSLWQFYPIKDAVERLNALPLRGENFFGYEVPLNEFEKETFHEINLVKRLYNVGGQKVFLTIMDGTKNRHVVHDPTYCFSGGGWKTVEQKKLPLAQGYAKIITMKKGEETKEFALWFTDGQVQHSSTIRYFLQATFRRLTLGKLTEEPVMMIVQPIDHRKKIDWKHCFNSFKPLNIF